PTDNTTTTAIDIARSSSGRGASDPSTFQYYGYALDAVGIASWPGGNSVNHLSVQEIRDIYACTVTNWNQVGGGNASIVRYIPQAGSGTRSFFINTVLGGANPSTSCGTPIEIQENDGTGVTAANQPNAIFPYSVAQWI